MSLEACAEIVRRGDPDRFLATMAAPVAARRVLFPLYAFNVEVARAPWISEEPGIAEIRLQWWHDALDEIATGLSARAHEVVTPLKEILQPTEAVFLQRNVDARRQDAYGDPLTSIAAWQSYLTHTSGTLMWVAVRGLARALTSDQAPADAHQSDEARALMLGTAQGLANYLLAVPDLLTRGRRPLPEMSQTEFAELVSAQLGILQSGPTDLARPSRPIHRIAELAAWRAPGVLRRALRDPAAIPEGRLEEAPIVRRATLLWRSFRV